MSTQTYAFIGDGKRKCPSSSQKASEFKFQNFRKTERSTGPRGCILAGEPAPPSSQLGARSWAHTMPAYRPQTGNTSRNVSAFIWAPSNFSSPGN